MTDLLLKVIPRTEVDWTADLINWGEVRHKDSYHTMILSKEKKIVTVSKKKYTTFIAVNRGIIEIQIQKTLKWKIDLRIQKLTILQRFYYSAFSNLLLKYKGFLSRKFWW